MRKMCSCCWCVSVTTGMHSQPLLFYVVTLMCLDLVATQPAHRPLWLTSLRKWPCYSLLGRLGKRLTSIVNLAKLVLPGLYATTLAGSQSGLWYMTLFVVEQEGLRSSCLQQRWELIIVEIFTILIWNLSLPGASLFGVTELRVYDKFYLKFYKVFNLHDKLACWRT